ncbi:AAA family ATPase [bacterium]|nr:AAA family ATPase [bacterium]
MHKDKDTFVAYGKKFQESVARLMMEDRPFCDQIEEVLELEFFDSSYLRAFVEIVLDYREKYEQHPHFATLHTEIKKGSNKYDGAVSKQLRDFVVRIQSEEINDKAYIKDQAIDFCKKQCLKKAILESANLVKKGDYDSITKIINEALTRGNDQNFGHDWFMDVDKRYIRESRSPITTGWHRMDEISKGGLGAKELAVVIAPTGAGKSMVLVHLGAQALTLGKKVVHYTLELADTVVGLRYDSCLSKVDLKDIMDSKEIVKEKISDIAGKLIIKEYPTKSASTKSIKNHLEKLKKQNILPDMVIVDYADLLRPVSSSAEKRHELEGIYEELRGMATEFECAFVTASQTNRGGLNAEVITMESISEAFNKCFVADFIFSLSRTPQDKQANSGRIFIAKNRNGPDGLVFPAAVDWSTVSIDVLERRGDEETPMLGPKEQLSNLQKYYTKHTKLSGSK